MPDQGSPGSVAVPGRWAQALEALHEISQALNAIRDLDRLLRSATERLSGLLDAEGASVILADAKLERFFFKAAYHQLGAVAEALQELDFPVTQGIAGWVFREGSSLLVEDASRDPRFYPGVDVQTGVRTHSLLCVPLRSRERMLGVLEVVNKRTGAFTEEDRRLAEALAGSLAVAIENARLIQELRAARERLREENFYFRESARRAAAPEGLVAESPKMRAVMQLIERILETTTTVLVMGESGTGKEVIARYIHYHGPRGSAPFIAVNCSAIPEALLEAELFGHEKGAFTGAARRKPGRFELASGGTLFLDEIGDMTPVLQAKLLRVLQEQRFERLGGTTTVTTDARIIAATHQDLPHLIAAGRFRQDLYYRLNVFPIILPPLRERQEDILPLARAFLVRYSRELRKPVTSLSARVEELLLRYHWPGNVRELENVIERAVILSRGTVVTEEELPGVIRQPPPGRPLGTPVLLPSSGVVLADVERDLIVQALERAGYNKSRASRLLGLSRTQLWTRIKRYGLTAPRVEETRHRRGADR